jgi:hypothetical protein
VAATPTTPSLNTKSLSKQIQKQIPKPKQRKWHQIGAKAAAGDAGALARLTKRGLVKSGTTSTTPPSGGKGKGGSTGGGSSDGVKITPYKPPAITDEMLAKSPAPGATAGTYHDNITGLDVTANFGPNPYHPGGGTSGGTNKAPAPLTGKEIGSQPIGRRKTIKRLGVALQKARKSGDDEKAKRLHHHIKRLRNLHYGESLPRPTGVGIKQEIAIARANGDNKEMARLKGQLRRLRKKRDMAPRGSVSPLPPGAPIPGTGALSESTKKKKQKKANRG